MTYFKYDKETFLSVVYNMLNDCNGKKKCHSYLCFNFFPPSVVEKFEQIQGVQHQWSGCYILESEKEYLLPYMRGGLTGVFDITELSGGPKVVENVLFAHYAGTRFVVVTAESEFPQKIQKPLIDKVVGRISTEELNGKFLSASDSLFFTYDEVEEDEQLVDGYIHTNSSEMLVHWNQGEFSLKKK